MERHEIEEVRERVSCGTVLMDAGFLLDDKESSRRALKFRRGTEIIIVTHGGTGWFDPLSDRKGDVFALACLLHRIPFGVSIQRISALCGLPLRARDYRGPTTSSLAPIAERWRARPVVAVRTPSYRFLAEARALPSSVLRQAASAGLLRQGPQGSAWFRHDDSAGSLSGWEERGARWRGFSTGGSKSLFRFGSSACSRICITEAAIDALSLAAIEGLRADTLYASTGGGWSVSTVQAIEAIAMETMLVAATDADPQGEVYADRLRQIADLAGGDFMRLRPRAVDWNEELKERRR